MIVAKLPNSFRPVMRDDNIRVGSKFDGGYIIPSECLDSADVIVSMGVNLDWSFETQVLDRFRDKKLISFDKTTTFKRAVAWGVSRFCYSPISRKSTHYSAILKPFQYLGFVNRKWVNHVAKFVGLRDDDETISISNIFKNYFDGPSSKGFFKIDIEGAEYDILPELIKFPERVTGMALEFHDVDSEPRFKAVIADIQKSFLITHLHVNNHGGVNKQGLPNLLEITFINKELADINERGAHDYWPGQTYVNDLDTPNVTEKPDVQVSFEE